MTIRNSYTIDIKEKIELYKERRHGLIFEDDKIFSIRRFVLLGVSEYEKEPGNINTKVRAITFAELECEYEYWYLQYGKNFNNLDFNDEIYFTDHNFKNLKTVEFNYSASYGEELAHCVRQSHLSGFEGCDSLIENAFSFAITCPEFQFDVPF